jgi:hypothetical protein
MCFKKWVAQIYGFNSLLAGSSYEEILQKSITMRKRVCLSRDRSYT